MSEGVLPPRPGTAEALPLALRHAVSLLPAEAAVDDTRAAPPDTSVQAVPSRKTDGRAVLVQIVEDLPRVQQLLKQLVEQPGRFEVTGIDDTEQDALNRYRRQRPDALVVDLNLRQGSGLGLIQAVRREHGPAPEGPVIIVVTNHTMPVLQTACIKAGANHFLDKSRELPRLSALLQQAFYP